jgi:hypothetical protein
MMHTRLPEIVSAPPHVYVAEDLFHGDLHLIPPLGKQNSVEDITPSTTTTTKPATAVANRSMSGLLVNMMAVATIMPTTADIPNPTRKRLGRNRSAARSGSKVTPLTSNLISSSLLEVAKSVLDIVPKDVIQIENVPPVKPQGPTETIDLPATWGEVHVGIPATHLATGNSPKKIF